MAANDPSTEEIAVIGFAMDKLTLAAQFLPQIYSAMVKEVCEIKADPHICQLNQL